MSDADVDPFSEDWAEVARSIEANGRPWGYWHWRDKAVSERAAADEVLTAAGLNVVDLRSRSEDPPDCDATVDGLLWGIEVTEIVHQRTLEQALKLQQTHGGWPKGTIRYFEWDRQSLLTAIQKRIDKKDEGKVKGGPYDRYALVIVTDEFHLHRETVEEFLAGATFRARLITDVFLGLSYHPGPASEGGSCPVFRLDLRTPGR